MLLRFFGSYFAGVMFKVVPDGPLIGHLKEAIVSEKHQRKGKERKKVKLIKTKIFPKNRKHLLGPPIFSSEYMINIHTSRKVCYICQCSQISGFCMDFSQMQEAYTCTL